MSRKTRMYLPGIPAHVVQRGQNRSSCFFADDDYQFYHEGLGQGLHRYIEPNPVRPASCHAWGKTNGLIEDHELCLGLDRDRVARQYVYRELFKHQLPEAQLHDIRECLAYNFPLGNDRFREAIETALGRRVGERKRGRPAARNGVAQI